MDSTETRRAKAAARTAAASEALAAFNAKFRPATIPAGAENRQALQAAENERALAAAALPQNQAEHRRLLAAWVAAERSEKAIIRAIRLAASPAHVLRQAIFARLRRGGYVREHRSESGSVYCARPRDDGTGIDRVRVSDHGVPMSRDRADSEWSGGSTWAGGGMGWEIIVTDDLDDADRAEIEETLRFLV